MASSGILVFIFPVLCICAVKSGFVKVECKAENVGHYGQQSLLECVVKTSSDVNDPNIRMVAWKKLTSPEDEGDLVLGFKRGKLDEPKRGYRFAEPSWDGKNMNVSLLITNTAVADEGDYKCIVITDSGDDNMVTTLKVQAKYSVPTVYSIPEKIVPNTDSTLVCESHGGYPQGTIRWFDEEKHEWTKSSEMDAKQSDDGLFQLTSRLSLLGGSTFSKYTCAVFNASGGKEDEKTFEMPPPPSSQGGLFVPGSPETSKVVAPLVVIGSLIIGLLLLLLYKRRSQKARRNSTAPLMDRRDAAPTDVEEGYNSHEDEPINQAQS
ncbi:CD276 antigen homolog isoform X1 [Maylandia zebra]|uniref:CD276 antigen homolog isoform X1 n=1 Tax=Maylandia zebra TaxID=106582 RepID=UPI00403D0CFA